MNMIFSYSNEYSHNTSSVNFIWALRWLAVDNMAFNQCCEKGRLELILCVYRWASRFGNMQAHRLHAVDWRAKAGTPDLIGLRTHVRLRLDVRGRNVKQVTACGAIAVRISYRSSPSCCQYLAEPCDFGLTMSRPDQGQTVAQRLQSFHVGEHYELLNLVGEGAYGTVW